MRPTLQRLYFWSSLLKRSVWSLIPIPFAILSAIFAIRDEFLSSDQAARLKMPAWLPDLPWYGWTIATFALIVIALLEGSYRAFAKPPRLIDPERSFLFLDRPELESWKATIIFVRSGRLTHVCLDVSIFIDPGWSRQTVSPLRQAVDFVKGHPITIEIMALDNHQPRRFWRWVTTGDERSLVSQEMHECRLVFLAEDGAEDYFNFIIESCGDNDTMRVLIGENRFAFAQKLRSRV